jgi:hypothetical protein
LVIASIVEKKSFKKQCQQLDSATRDHLATRLDYYQVNIDMSKKYRANPSLLVTNCFTSITASKTIYSLCQVGLVWDVSIHKYTVTVNTSYNMNILIGFAPSKLFRTSQNNNHRSCGWYLHLCKGELYAQNGDSGKAYWSKCKLRYAITCIYNASSSEISFEKNGVSLGVAYTNVNGEDIAPAVELYHVDDTITLSID